MNILSRTCFRPALFSLTALALATVGCGSDRGAGADDPAPSAAVHDGDDYELGIGMAWLQRWTTKLWYAGDAANWELADFYLHEVEETLEDMIAAGITEDGHDVSALLKGMLAPQVESLEGAVDQQDIDLFRQNYRAMVMQCNACHVATEHGFLVMEVPQGPAPFAQRFEP